MKKLFLLPILILITLFSTGQNTPLYLDSNGVTIKCQSDVEIGYSDKVNGITYTVVSEAQLRTMIANNEDITTVCTSKITNMKNLFFSSKVNGDISKWDVSNVTDMSHMFHYTQFNGDISKWDVGNVINMSFMFCGGSGFFGVVYNPFNGDLSKWDVKNVTDMSFMFKASEFKGDISNWDVSQVTNMNEMFRRAKFNIDLSRWNVSKVTKCYKFSEKTPEWTEPKPNFTNCDNLSN